MADYHFGSSTDGTNKILNIIMRLRMMTMSMIDCCNEIIVHIIMRLIMRTIKMI